MDYSLSSEQVQRVAGGKIPIYIYEELKQFNTLADLLRNQHKAVIILYQWGGDERSAIGHWCCIFEDKNGEIEFFDSFGYAPDNEFKTDYSTDGFIPENIRKKFGQDFRQLSYLMSTTAKPLNYNEFIFQSKKSETCGRWVGYRLRNRMKHDLYEFAKQFEKYADDSDGVPDELILHLTKQYA